MSTMSPETFADIFDIPLDPPVSDEQGVEQLLVAEAMRMGSIYDESALSEPSESVEGSLEDPALPPASRRKTLRQRVISLGVNLALVASLMATADSMYHHFALADCVEPQEDVDLRPNETKLAEQVQSIDFVENDMERLNKVRHQLDEAGSLEQTKAIASAYFDVLGINVHFDEVPSISLRRAYDNPILHNLSVTSSSMTDEQLQGSVRNVVEAIAATPQKLLGTSAKTSLYVPDNYTGGERDESGRALGDSQILPFVEQDKIILLKLEGVQEDSGVYWHELGHELDFEACHPIENDSRYRKLNPEWFDYIGWGEATPSVYDARRAMDRYVVPSGYAMTSTTEDKAEVFRDMMQFGLSPQNSDRGSSPMDAKAELLLGRFVRATGLIELPALVALQKTLAPNVHPLERLASKLAVFDNPNPEFPGTFEFTEEYTVPTFLGAITVRCRPVSNDQRDYLDDMCGVSLTGADSRLVSTDTPEDPWYKKLGDVAEFVAEKHMQTTNLRVTTSAGGLDTDYPQESIAEFVFTKVR